MGIIAACHSQEKGPIHIALIIALPSQKIRCLSHTIHQCQSKISNRHLARGKIPNSSSVVEGGRGVIYQHVVEGLEF